MDTDRTSEALAKASTVLTRPGDVAGSLATLLDATREGLGVDTAGVLVLTERGLDLLAASTHVAAELEIHQLQGVDGPCIEAFETGTPVEVHGAEAVVARWPGFGPTMVEAGFSSVHASPLVWQQDAVGAMGLFRRTDAPFGADEEAVARAFADIATIVLVNAEEVEGAVLAARVQEALRARVQVELAKGVLADAHDLSMADAYELLVTSARDRRVPLTAWAEKVVDGAHARPSRDD